MLATWAAALAGTVAAIAAAIMIFHSSLYVCAICLLVILLQIAVFFFLAGAPSLAFLQVMIYAGAVMILVVIVIMASPRPQATVWSEVCLPRPLAVAVLLLPLAELGVLAWRGISPESGLGRAWPVQALLGPVLFKEYAAATEAVTLLMLLAGLAIIERRPEQP
jgi:NADH-quinone oxidoreductase subunit J